MTSLLNLLLFVRDKREGAGGGHSLASCVPGLLAAVSMMVLTQCAREPRVIIEGPGGEKRATVRVEVAGDPAAREVGLMFRKQLAPDAGMLFVFPQPRHQVFWMHNTEIPLDMIFAGSNRRVIGIIANAQPYSDATLEVPGDSLYVLEVNGGFCKQHGVRAGDRLEFFHLSPDAIN